eukprot:CAMPEP_0197362396 /NCGR_PEP_ID=MMETSP0893-20130614/63985_1 /TAXON_ID=44058 ORGANISM="Aureoumbra lagunensis, Strain CCMP1510" /NCGR_SAMPLE_ID=MMETSP0893 /ASSEMBLY_ACC=CAM_ASM_000539 /LENGTH=252 /DNA_ID=CAMNT_0042884179 /DNA_START=222 /DNA_END=978 /DNA_ORIENTATION=+
MRNMMNYFRQQQKSKFYAAVPPFLVLAYLPSVLALSMFSAFLLFDFVNIKHIDDVLNGRVSKTTRLICHIAPHALARHELFQAAAKEQAELRSRLLKAVEAQKRDAKLLEEALKKLEAAAQRRSAALRGDDADTPWAQAAARERAAAAQLLALQEESGSITEYNELQEQCSKAETQLEAVSIQLKNVLEQEQRARANYLEFLKQDEQGKLRTQANLLALALSDAEMRMHTKKQFFDFSLLGEQQQGFSSSFL